MNNAFVIIIIKMNTKKINIIVIPATQTADMTVPPLNAQTSLYLSILFTKQGACGPSDSILSLAPHSAS